MDYGICDEICLPARSRANLAVDRGQVQNKDLIDAALTKRSQPASGLGLQAADCDLRAEGDDFVLSASFAFSGDLDPYRLVVVETGSDHIWVSEADHRIEGGSLQVEADLQYYGDGAMTLDRSALRFTMLNDGQSVEISGCNLG
jgi:DsbC/DsbD-like thiol-disulfide interchange protein